jgi:hypothetical protein
LPSFTRSTATYCPVNCPLLWLLLLLLLLLCGLGLMSWLSAKPLMAAQPLVMYTFVNCSGPLSSPCHVQLAVNSAAAAAAAASAAAAPASAEAAAAAAAAAVDAQHREGILYPNSLPVKNSVAATAVDTVLGPMWKHSTTSSERIACQLMAQNSVHSPPKVCLLPHNLRPPLIGLDLAPVLTNGFIAPAWQAEHLPNAWLALHDKG